ncbi:hypothetical protein WN55_07796 [Dufourea novaeangliae]|uniref:Uncharacterized protein n=1 Tax=Dufourea novaeangliae TaxID=178035 RepID=A0A154P4G4_DUFNO|nr:hypothetical protein WN55_07796 [Dufourea novaeangliae]
MRWYAVATRYAIRDTIYCVRCVSVRTFPSHAHLQALFQPTKLALIPMVLVDGTVPIPPTRVR